MTYLDHHDVRDALLKTLVADQGTTYGLCYAMAQPRDVVFLHPLATGVPVDGTVDRRWPLEQTSTASADLVLGVPNLPGPRFASMGVRP